MVFLWKQPSFWSVNPGWEALPVLDFSYYSVVHLKNCVCISSPSQWQITVFVYTCCWCSWWHIMLQKELWCHFSWDKESLSRPWPCFPGISPVAHQDLLSARLKSVFRRNIAENVTDIKVKTSQCLHCIKRAPPHETIKDWGFIEHLRQCFSICHLSKSVKTHLWDDDQNPVDPDSSILPNVCVCRVSIAPSAAHEYNSFVAL